MPAIGDHYRSTDETVPAGVYRVVGTADPVVLLRVATEDGRRATGEIHAIDEAALDASFEPAEDPDAGIHPIRGLVNAASGLYWRFRRLV